MRAWTEGTFTLLVTALDILASKVGEFSEHDRFLAQSLLVNVTLRETKANQFGILGFGGDKNNGYSTQFEGSAAYLFSRKFAIGAEFRTKPDNLSIAREDNAFDVFAAYFITKNVSATVAYVNLGNIVIHDNQQGVYLSLQAGL